MRSNRTCLRCRRHFVIVLPGVAVLVLFVNGCGSGQPSPKQTESAVTPQQDEPEKGAPAAEDSQEPAVQPQSEQEPSRGFWLSRTAKPARDALIISLKKPVIESDGAISVGQLDRARRSPGSSKSVFFGKIVGRPINSALASLILGRELQRGERAYVHDPKIEFMARDASVPAGDRRQIAH